jgi:hypothetical protein
VDVTELVLLPPPEALKRATMATNTKEQTRVARDACNRSPVSTQAIIAREADSCESSCWSLSFGTAL